ncbi:hypothetical protein N7535_002182 [Penicillium sp. DV-2018c]|nr:hypothetical protein N7535_002182 [Penicillium sp. DV-2018c]
MASSPNSNLRGFNHAVQTLLKQPTQFLPHLTIPTFTHLPENLGPHLVNTRKQFRTSTPEKIPRTPTIRALVLDKDNTLCAAKTTVFPEKILSKLSSLRTSPTSLFNQTTSPNSILIVSNRAGSHAAFDGEVKELEAQLAHLRIPVFRLPAGSEKKPFCGDEVVQWFRERGLSSLHMKLRVWCKEGVFDVGETGKPERNILEKMEVWIEKFLRETRGYEAPLPKGWEKEKQL